MSNKVRAFPEINLAVKAFVHTANLAKGLFMKITDDETIDPVTTEDDFCVGTLEKQSRVADGSGTLRTRFRALVNVKCSGAIAAGDCVKIGTTSSSVQTFKKWTALSVSVGAIAGDSPDLIVGVCWIGAGNGETGTFLIL
jgi:hypothetical protein